MPRFQTPRGTRDFPPEEMMKRQYVFDTIRQVFESFGFSPMETPAFESWELLSAKGGGGEEVKDEIYYFRDKSNRELGLRFDLTVPMARFVASNPQLAKPFKRYQIGRAWRYDRPQAGRFREFWQADVDVIGAEGTDADAECIAVAVEALKRLGFSRFTVRLNSRKILNYIIKSAGVGAKDAAQVFRALDKLEKIGEAEVLKELKSAVGGKQAAVIMKMIKTKGAPSSLLKGNIEGVSELREVVEKAKAYGFADRIMVDFSLVRGLDYYTGPIFEISVQAKKNVGSVGGGGRYDNLIGLLGGAKSPATGISLGVERLMEIMSDESMFSLPASRTKAFIVAVKPELKAEALAIAKRLRSEGIAVQTDLMGRNMKKQLEYADACSIPYAIIVGDKELKEKRFLLKDMSKKIQKAMSVEQIARALGKA